MLFKNILILFLITSCSMIQKSDLQKELAEVSISVYDNMELKEISLNPSYCKDYNESATVLGKETVDCIPERINQNVMKPMDIPTELERQILFILNSENS